MKKRLLSMLLALALCLGFTVPALAAEPTFADVPSGHWAYEAIEDMAGREVVNGVAPGRFAPDDKVACADFSTMLVRLLFKEELEKHTDKTYWWQPYADTLLEAGVLDNTMAKAFYIRAMYNWDKVVMEQPMRRYDMAQIMYNALKVKGFELPSDKALAAARKGIADYTDIPLDYDDAVAAMYAIECLKGMDPAGNFRGNEKMDRAQACTVLVRLQNALEAQNVPEKAPDPSAEPTPAATSAPGTTPSPKPSANPEPSSTPEPTPEPTPIPTPEPTPQPSAAPLANLDAVQQEMLDLINKERAKVGASPLTLDAAACRAAQVRAEELVQQYSHTRPDGSRCFTALNEAQVRYRAAGENIAAGYRSVALVMDGWMNSPGHRANILSSDFSKVGIGFCYNPNGTGGYGYYWAQMFIG